MLMCSRVVDSPMTSTSPRTPALASGGSPTSAGSLRERLHLAEFAPMLDVASELPENGGLPGGP